MSTASRNAFDEIATAFASPAANRNYGERVTIAEHMLQAAAHSRADGADDTTVVATLLHDVGHLLPSPDADERNRRHADAGAEWLVELGFGPEVTEPVRLHIPAKRHLVNVDPGYFATLSPASVHTLRLQGGPMTDDESAAFLAEPYSEIAMSVRRWDEAGKVTGAIVAPLDAYADSITESAGR